MKSYRAVRSGTILTNSDSSETLTAIFKTDHTIQCKMFNTILIVRNTYLKKNLILKLSHLNILLAFGIQFSYAIFYIVYYYIIRFYQYYNGLFSSNEGGRFYQHYGIQSE